MNRIILGLDVSTTATGAVLYNEATQEHIPRLFTASGDVTTRIKTIAKDIKEWIEPFSFDMILISKASYAQMNASILQLEGILLGIAIDRDIDFDYFGDSSWYSLIGNIKDERPTKKATSVKRYLMHNYHPDDVERVEKVWKGSKLDKIIVHMKDGKQITDDIADSYNAASLLIKREKRNKVRFEVSETQKALNKLRAKKKKITQSVKLTKQDIALNKQEHAKYRAQWEATGNKQKYNSMALRENREAEMALKIQGLEGEKSEIQEQIDALMAKKDNL